MTKSGYGTCDNKITLYANAIKSHYYVVPMNEIPIQIDRGSTFRTCLLLVST